MPLPASLGGFPARYRPSARVFYVNGAVYILALAAAGSSSVACYRSTDPATTAFAEQHAAGRPSEVSEIWAIAAQVVGSNIHVVTSGSANGEAGYTVFSTATNTWGARSNITNGSSTIKPAKQSSNLGIASDGATLSVWLQGRNTSVMGTGYFKVHVYRRSGGSWAVNLDATGDNVSAIDYTGARAVMTANNRHHGIFRRGSDNALLLGTYLPLTGTFGQSGTTSPSPAVVANLTTAAVYSPAGAGVAYLDGATTKVRFPVVTSTGKISIVGFDDANAPTATVTNASVTAQNCKINSDGIALCALVNDGTTLYLLYIRENDDDLGLVTIGGAETNERALAGITALEGALLDY